MPDWVSLVRYRTCFGIVSFFQSGTGLTGCRTVRHSGISIYMSMDIDMDMKHWHWMQQHAAWTCTCSMDMDMDMDTQHGFVYAAWTWTVHMHGCTDAGMPECRWKAQSGIDSSVSLYCLVRHRHSGIMVSPVPLVTDQSVSAQLWV
jgi:hypothetical protein